MPRMTIISINRTIDKYLKSWSVNKQGYPFKELPNKHKNNHRN